MEVGAINNQTAASFFRSQNVPNCKDQQKTKRSCQIASSLIPVMVIFGLRIKHALNHIIGTSQYE